MFDESMYTSFKESSIISSVTNTLSRTAFITYLSFLDSVIIYQSFNHDNTTIYIQVTILNSLTIIHRQ